jgi:hypothetical protein
MRMSAACIWAKVSVFSVILGKMVSSQQSRIPELVEGLLFSLDTIALASKDVPSTGSGTRFCDRLTVSQVPSWR